MTMTQNINDSLSGSCRCVICNLPATGSARILKACNTVDPDFPQIYCCDNIANIAPATNIGKILLNFPPSINWFKARATSGCNLFITSSRSYQCHQGNLFSVTLFELDVFRLNVQQMTTGLCTHGVFRYQLILGLVSIHWIDFIKYKLLFLLRLLGKVLQNEDAQRGKSLQSGDIHATGLKQRLTLDCSQGWYMGWCKVRYYV